MRRVLQGEEETCESHGPSGDPSLEHLTLSSVFSGVTDETGQARRVLSTARLSVLPHVHLPPINVVVSHDPSGRIHLGQGFPLRCVQRFSRPDLATRHCRWHDNRYTRGRSVPVLSY